MRSIRDVAVFAWAVTGINGTLATYGHGRPSIGAQPADGLPVWEPNSGPTAYRRPEDREAPKESSDTGPAVGRSIVHPPAEASIHGYPRPRHSSLDERMYDSLQTRWSPATAAASEPAAYHYGEYDAAQYRRPLRPAFSYDTLHDHARHRQPYPPPSHVMPSRCSFPQEPWAEPSSSVQTRIPTPGAASSPWGSGTAEASGGGGYFWQQ